MQQEKINRYVDKLDVNTQANLLKKTLIALIEEKDRFESNEFDCDEVPMSLQQEKSPFLEDISFIAQQINEFGEQYKMKRE